MGLTPGVSGGAVELHRARQRPVVGERHGGHAELLHALDQRPHAAGAVEERVLAVDVEVDETGIHLRGLILPVGGGGGPRRLPNLGRRPAGGAIGAASYLGLATCSAPRPTAASSRAGDPRPVDELIRHRHDHEPRGSSVRPAASLPSWPECSRRERPARDRQTRDRPAAIGVALPRRPAAAPRATAGAGQPQPTGRDCSSRSRRAGPMHRLREPQATTRAPNRRLVEPPGDQGDIEQRARRELVLDGEWTARRSEAATRGLGAGRTWRARAIHVICAVRRGRRWEPRVRHGPGDRPVQLDPGRRGVGGPVETEWQCQRRCTRRR